MLFRALGLFACAFPIGWGLYSITVGDFGPMLGGAMFLIFGIVAALIIIGDGMEQKVNGSSTYAGGPLPKDAVVIDSMSMLDRYMTGQLTDADYAEIGAMCRQVEEPMRRAQASGHDDYPHNDQFEGILWDSLSPEQQAYLISKQPQLQEHFHTTAVLKAMNTPDPNLIHPDDAKRMTYTQFTGERRRRQRLDIKV